MDRLPAPLRSPLRDLAEALNDAEVDWRLGGSALLAILGMDLEVHDLDVTVEADALDAVQAACSGWLQHLHVGHAPPPWCSDWLAELRIGDIEVDVIGGFCIDGPSGPVRLPQDLERTCELDGVTIPLADPAVWWWVYGIYRPARAVELERIIPAARRRATERRLGQP